MILKVDHRELQNVCDVMNKDSDKMKAEINNMRKNLEKLRTIWLGQDSNIFCTNVENFLKAFESVPVTLDSLAKMSSESNNGYKSRDAEFAKALEAEAAQYE